MLKVAWTILGCVLFLLAFPGATGVTAAQPPASAPTETAATGPAALSDRAADDGLARLLEAVWELEVISDTRSQSLAGLFAAWPDAEYALRQALAAERQVSQPRQLRPGVLAVDVSITAERLNEVLQRIIQQTVRQERPQQVSLAASAGPAIFATGMAVDDGLPRDGRPGWRHCRPQDIILSQQAAEQDLRQRALTWLRRVRLADRQTVGQVARHRPEIDRSLRSQLERLTGGEPSFEASGTCVLKCTISAGQLTSMIARAFREAQLDQIDSLKPEAPFETLTLTAMSVAPPQPQPRPGRAARGPRPDWADRTLSKTAVAAGPPDETDISFRNQLAITAARVETQRQLWIELEQLALPSGGTIAQALTARADRAAMVQAIQDAIFVMSKPAVNEKGEATITLGIRLETVWQIMAQ